MDNFIVSARKYRPLSFETVVGQASITNTLKNAIKNNQLAHSYLFCGPRGIGKTTCARIFAKTINCSDLTPETEACGKCESCVSFSESRSYNIHELDAASNNSVDDIRNLTDQVRIPPQIGKYSVYIIDEVHMLSQQAFNAFLKTLEEPPKHAIFILATTEKHKIIPTILSRCQIYDFNRMAVEQIEKHLETIAQKENIKYEPEAFNIIAQKADGAMRDALSIFDQIASFSENNITYQKVIENLNILDYEYYFRLVGSFLTGDIPGVLLLYNEILNKGFDSHNFINGLSKHLRDLLIVKDARAIQLIEAGQSVKEKYKNQSAGCSAEFIFDALEITNTCDLNYKISKDKRLHVELSLIKLCNILQVQKKKQYSITENKHTEIQESKAVSELKITTHNDHVAKKSEPSFRFGEHKPPVVEKPYKKSTPSIKDALNSINSTKQELPVEEIQTNTTGPLINESRDFTNEELTEQWNNFAESIKDSKKRMHFTLKNRAPEIKDSNVIEVVMDNKSQEEEFAREVKPDLLNFLKKELKNNLIEVKTVIKETENNENRLYTDEDKFNHMSKKNPALLKLKKDLNLEFE